ALALGDAHTCVLLEGGAVRCWGLGANGRLGSGSSASIGDDEPAGAAPAVDVGGRATAISAGEAHTCALLDAGAIRCWGRGSWGSRRRGLLGDGGLSGESVAVSDAVRVELGSPAAAVTVSTFHSCAITRDGAVHCWGLGKNGQLGYGTTENVG